MNAVPTLDVTESISATPTSNIKAPPFVFTDVILISKGCAAVDGAVMSLTAFDASTMHALIAVTIIAAMIAIDARSAPDVCIWPPGSVAQATYGVLGIMYRTGTACGR